MKKLTLLFFCCVVSLGALAQQDLRPTELTPLQKRYEVFATRQRTNLPATPVSQRGFEAVPQEANLDKYPIFDHVLTLREQANLNLRPMALEHLWTGFNWYRGKQRFVLEALPIGTMVLVDANNIPVYKADCGNRLVPLPMCICAAHTPSVAPRSFSAETNQGHHDSIDTFWDFVKKLWKFLGALLLLLLGLAVFLILGALLVYLLHRLWQWLFASKDRSTPKPVPPTLSRTPSGASVTPGAVSTSSPAPIPADAPSRRFVACYPGSNMTDQTKVRSSGCKEIHVEQTMEGDDLMTTIRFR